MRSVHFLVASLSLAAFALAARAAEPEVVGSYCTIPPLNSSASPRQSVGTPHTDLRPTNSAEAAGDTVLYDFRAEWCGPCRSMDPVVGQLLGQGYPIRRVNVDQDRELANRFGVEGIPCFVMVVNGKEVDRVVGATNISRLEAMFSRNGVDASPGTVRAQSPDPQNSRLDAIIARSRAPQAVPFPVTGAPTDQQPTNLLGATAGLPSSANHENAESSDFNRKPNTPYDQLIRASVRLRIEDETGDSVGSGTIIDARAGEALIITCGHVFREAVKDGRISVDLFGPGAPKGVTGTLIDYDLNSEVGLISIHTNYPVAAAHLAPPGYTVHPNDRVVSIGCDGGADATAKETRVTSINRYVGAPNVQVAFQPVQGRSGGGLFTPEGFVVGVCYAADPIAHEGLFAALPALCDELDHVKLGFICRSASDGQRYAAATSEMAGRLPQSTPVAPQSTSSAIQPTDVAPASFRREPTASAPADLSSFEQTALTAMREKNDGSEAICIVRDSQGHSEIVVLDHVGPDFVQRLAAERPSGSARQLTSLELPQATPPKSSIAPPANLQSTQSAPPPAAPAAKHLAINSANSQLAPTAIQPWWSDLAK